MNTRTVYSIETEIANLKREQSSSLRQHETLREIMGSTYVFMSFEEQQEKIARCKFLAERLQAIPDEIKALELQLPCQAFVDKFGSELWELYKEKYPVNKDTEFIEFFNDNAVAYYPIPEMQSITAFSMEHISPSFYTPKQGEARFEQWSDGNPNHAYRRLAYAPEINTVYWRTR